MLLNIPTDVPKHEAKWVLIVSGRIFNAQLSEKIVDYTREDTLTVAELREALEGYPADAPIYLHGGAGARCVGNILTNGF